MSVRRLRKPLLALAAVAALAAVLSACAFYKEGSLQLTQPGEIGPVRIHMVLCSGINEGKCGAPEENEEGQTYLAFAVPKGTVAPDSFAAVTEPPSAPPLVFRRNQSAAEALGRLETGPGDPPWPPIGSELVGYMSDVQPDLAGEAVEWTVDPEFGLPVPADGGPYGGAFLLALAIGQRNAEGATEDKDRPAFCPIGKEESFREECRILKGARTELRVTDLRVKAGATPTVAAGKEASVPFTLDVGTTAASIPSFALSATTTLPGAAASVAESPYQPSAPTGADRRTSAPRSVTVKVPADAKSGTYNVTLTAKTAAGATVTQTGSFNVTALPVPPAPPKASFKLGKATLNKAKGTATLAVQVSTAGTLSASGKKVVKTSAKASGPATLKLTIKAKGKAKKKLNRTGKAKVKATLAFQPGVGAAVSQIRTLTLKKNPPK